MPANGRLTRVTYSDEQKMQVVQQWLALGNLKLVAANTDIPLPTIKYWRGEPWWADYENEIRAGRRFVVDKKLSQIIDKTFDIMEDRLEHGDWVFDQVKGEIVRRPVPFKEAANAATNLMQRQQVLEQQNNDEYNKDATKSIQDQLALLANEFAKFNNKTKANAQVIEYKEIKEPDDAVHEEWEPGLQTGSEAIHEQAGGSQEEGRAEQSPQDDGESGESS